LDASSQEDFIGIKNQMTHHWSSEFLAYFNKDLNESIEATVKWKLLETGLYKEGSGITINAAESLNAVLGRITQNTEMPTQTFIMCLYHLDIFFSTELLRGYCGLGNYKLKYFNLKRDPSNVEFSRVHFTPDHLPFALQNAGNLSKFSEIKRDENTEFTHLAVAKTLIAQNKIQFVPQFGNFVVGCIGDDGDNHLVTMYPKETCTCKLQINCHHITAVRVSLRKEEKKSNVTKLVKILKRKKGRSGRKNPTHITKVLSAEDSLAYHKNEECESYIVPMKNHEGQIKNIFHSATSYQQNNSHIIKNNESLKLFENESCYTSTPVKIKKTDKKLEIHNNMDISDNFSDNFREYKIFGIFIDTKSLTCLDMFSPKDGTKSWLTDSIVDAYLRIMWYESECQDTSGVIAFTGECFVLSVPELCNTNFNTQALYFVLQDIPNRDLVIFPCCLESHFTLIVCIRKLKYVLYLDSKFQEHKTKKIPIAIQNFYCLLSASSKVVETPFDITEWKTFFPSDLPQQNNNIDCGVYILKYTSAIFQRFTGIINVDIKTSREHIKRKLMEYDSTTFSSDEHLNSYVAYLDIDKKYIKQKILDLKMDSFEYLPISTLLPLKNKMTTVHFLTEIISLISQDSLTLGSDIYDTFEYNCRRDEEFVVHGVPISWNKVIPSKGDELEIDPQNFILYLRMLHFNERETLKKIEVDVFTSDLIDLISTTVFKTLVEYFIRWKFTERDIIIVPYQCAMIIRMIIVLRNNKTIIGLSTDGSVSIGYEINKDCIITFLKAYSTACFMDGIPFNAKEWTFHIPTDVYSVFDWGNSLICTLMYAKIIFKQDHTIIENYLKKLPFIKHELREEIIDHMRKYNKRPLHNPKKTNNIVINDYVENNLMELVTFTEIENIEMMLADILKTYWKNLAGGQCAYENNCNSDFTEKLIHCVDCWKWFHKSCDSEDLSAVKGHYICKNCSIK